MEKRLSLFVVVVSVGNIFANDNFAKLASFCGTRATIYEKLCTYPSIP